MDKDDFLRAYLMVDAYKEFNGTIEVLHNDVEYGAEMLNKEDKQFWRRALVRALFAMIEGVTYRMQQIALRASQQPRVAFSPGELQVLLEKSFELDSDGKVVERQIRTSLKGIIRFAFRAYARVHVADYELDVGREDEWGAFVSSIKVRDRLMHPKNAADLNVSDAEMTSAQRTFDWFMKSLKKVQEVSLAALEEDVRKNPPPSAVSAPDSEPASK
ncbi:MAG: hypothetical protein ACREBG_12125 [Pyrinomonadaceae bacterium]